MNPLVNRALDVFTEGRAPGAAPPPPVNRPPALDEPLASRVQALVAEANGDHATEVTSP